MLSFGADYLAENHLQGELSPLQYRELDVFFSQDGVSFFQYTGIISGSTILVIVEEKRALYMVGIVLH